MFGVDVGLVPGAERLKPLHDQMAGVDHRRFELPCAVPLKLSATSAMYLGEFRKQKEAQCRGTKPPPAAT